jgi:hypothetical protein
VNTIGSAAPPIPPNIALLYEHFEVADEILVETIDVATRTLTSRSEKIADLDAYASIAP